ncbi:MAG TPA: DHA2 family efflux MFS transporter permease subunit [Ktedonobacteraceae bacterium]|nr:DHA2 family efflux MFS transporter permease subunit [Ktedonobacteraceae bacterium]
MQALRLSYRWQATFVIAIGLLMAILDSTIVSVVLPQIAVAFHTDYSTITWVGTGYFLANAAVIPIVGYLSDRAGSKTMFLIALGLFTLGSALCVIAPSAQWLIAFRVLQGIGGGALLPVAMAVIFRLFAPTERAGAIALLMIPLLLGPAFGPTLGGYLATNFSWNAIFTINLPIGIVAFVLALFVLRGKAAEREANGEEEQRGLDLAGLLLSMTGFTAFVYGINEAGSRGWGDPTVITFLVAGGVLLVACTVVELLVKDPVIDVRLFRSYTFTIANVLVWATTGIFFASIFLLPYFFENVEGLSALSTGEIVISQGLAMAIGLALSGKLYNRVGPRLLVAVGLVIVAVSMLGFTHLDVTTSGADVQVWLILRGLGLGMAAQPLQTLAVSVVSNSQMARASSLMNSTKTVFGAVGVAVFTTYLTQQATAHARDIAASLAARPLNGIAATCARQAGQHAQALSACVTQHALTMGLNDTFLFALFGSLICVVAALFLGRDPAIEAAREAKKRGEAVEERSPVPMVSE